MFSGRALKLNPYLVPIDVCSSGGRRGREAGWKFQGAFHGVSQPFGTHQYAQEHATPHKNTSMKSAPAQCRSWHHALATLCVLQQNPLGCQPAFLAGSSLTQHPWGWVSVLYKLTEANQDQISFFPYLTLANILTFIKVNFHTNWLNENKIPLRAPEAEMVTGIVMNFCDK